MPTNAPASRKTVYRGLRRTCAVSMRRSSEGLIPLFSHPRIGREGQGSVTWSR